MCVGITPSYQEAQSYVYQQRIEQYQDLHHALVTIQQINPVDQDNHTELVTKLFMMQEGLFRLIDIPKVTCYVWLASCKNVAISAGNSSLLSSTLFSRELPLPMKCKIFILIVLKRYI